MRLGLVQHPIRSGRPLAILALLATALATSGFSSCAGSVGPLLVNELSITPNEVLLRSSVSTGQEAIGLAKVDGSSSGERLNLSFDYGKDAGVHWLTVEVAGRILTLHANPAGLAEGVYLATVTIEAEGSGASGHLRVEFTVQP